MTRTRTLAWPSRLGGALLLLALLLPGCAVLPPPAERAPSVSIAADPGDLLTRVAAQSVTADPAKGDSAFRPLPFASYAMDARLTLVRNARHSIDLQCYLLQNDLTGHTLARAVRDAAARGVRVRLLVDDLYTADNIQMLLGLAAYDNVEVRLFNPFAGGRGFGLTRWLVGLNEFSRINHRMHNKLLVVDGAFAIAGGRNMADEYFFSSKAGNFVDFDLLVAGAAVPQLASIFDTYWNSPRIYPLQAIETAHRDAQDLRDGFERLTVDGIDGFPPPPADQPDLLGYFPLSGDIAKPPLKLLHGHIDAFADDPEKVSGRAERGGDETTVTARVGKALAEAKSKVVVGSPYFIPGELGMSGLRAARAHGVEVEVITNSLASNDEPFASAAYARYRVPMLQLGAQLYETDSSQLKNDALIGTALGASTGRSHSKLIIIDRRLTFVGSMNMDFRSSRLNTELGMLVDSPELAAQVGELGERVRAIGSYRLRLAEGDGHLQWVAVVNGVEKVYDSEPNVDFGTRLQLWLFFPFISEGLL